MAATRFWIMADSTSRRTSSTSATSPSGSATCSPTATPPAAVPPCPDWRADDLLWHLGEVQHFWTWMVDEPPEGPRRVRPSPSGPATMPGCCRSTTSSSSRWSTRSRAADPTDEAWTWSQDHTVAFIYRRQAHEALIHRRDAELAAGTITPFPADLAADGVDEVLDVMYGGCPPWGEFSPLPHYVRLDLTDTGDQVWVQLGRFHGTDPEGITTTRTTSTSSPTPASSPTP